MAPVIDKYAKANGYGLLFDSSNPWPQGPLLWATSGVDLTKTDRGRLQRAVHRSSSS